MNGKEITELFGYMHPGFFEPENCGDIPEGVIFREMILPLHGGFLREYEKLLSADVSFGFYEGSISAIKDAVAAIDDGWAELYDEESRVYCGFVSGKHVSFCLLDSMGEYRIGGRTIKIGGPGCVGTLPEYRGRGTGLAMVERATKILRDEGYDISYIHYTAVSDWYARLGYRTVLEWDRNGIIAVRGFDEA